MYVDDMQNGSPLFLSEEEVAEALGISPGTLRNWRHQKKGPRWATNPDTGRFFGYTQEALDEWVARAVSS